MKLLVDTSVWVSYFGDRSSDPEGMNRIEFARQVIDYCLDQKYTLCFCTYIVNELNKGSNKNRQKNIEKLKTIAEHIPGSVGNETWDNIEETWDKINDRWGDQKVIEKDKKFEKILPDKKNKPNRIDRKIVLTASEQGVNILLHENPKDFNRFCDIEETTFIDLLTVKNIEDFKKALEAL